MLNHTPGPWKWSAVPASTGMDALILDSEGFPLAHVVGVTNAPVLAAAPDLLKVVKRLRQTYSDLMYSEHKDETCWLPLCIEADEVIAKATAAPAVKDTDNG